METLARATPLLKGDLASAPVGPTAALALIAGPLAGLHVTFGTSVVAILVTLALALIQGDVTLHHERLLALLQERTRHVLVPELWPADESVGERTVRALRGASCLRRGVADGQRGGERRKGRRRRARRGSAAGRADRRRDARPRRAAQAAALRRRPKRRGGSLRRGARGFASRDDTRRPWRHSRGSREAIGRVEARARRSTARGVARGSRPPRRRRARRWRPPSRRSPRRRSGRSRPSRRRPEAAVAALGELRGSLSAQLEGGLASARDGRRRASRRGRRRCRPRWPSWRPSWAALTAEVALLAARADSPEQPNAVLDELVRLGEDVERLVASSQPATASTEAAAREAGS